MCPAALYPSVQVYYQLTILLSIQDPVATWTLVASIKVCGVSLESSLQTGNTGSVMKNRYFWESSTVSAAPSKTSKRTASPCTKDEGSSAVSFWRPGNCATVRVRTPFGAVLCDSSGACRNRARRNEVQEYDRTALKLLTRTPVMVFHAQLSKLWYYFRSARELTGHTITVAPFSSFRIVLRKWVVFSFSMNVKEITSKMGRCLRLNEIYSAKQNTPETTWMQTTTTSANNTRNPKERKHASMNCLSTETHCFVGGSKDGEIEGLWSAMDQIAPKCANSGLKWRPR